MSYGPEARSPGPLRAVVRLTGDSGRGFERELVFSEPAAAEAPVRAWLDDVLAGERCHRRGAARRKRSSHRHAA
jgi:hypothetical protein